MARVTTEVPVQGMAQVAESHQDFQTVTWGHLEWGRLVQPLWRSGLLTADEKEQRGRSRDQHHHHQLKGSLPVGDEWAIAHSLALASADHTFAQR